MKTLIKNAVTTTCNAIVNGAVKFEDWSRHNPKKATAVIFVVGCAEGMIWNKTIFKKFYNKYPKVFTLLTIVSSAGHSAQYYNYVTRFQLKLDPIEVPKVSLTWKTEIK